MTLSLTESFPLTIINNTPFLISSEQISNNIKMILSSHKISPFTNCNIGWNYGIPPSEIRLKIANKEINVELSLKYR